MMIDPLGTNWFTFAALIGGCATSAIGGYEATRKFQIDAQRYREQEQKGTSSAVGGTAAKKRAACEREEVESGAENKKLLRDALQPVNSGLEHYGPPGVKIFAGAALTAVGARSMKGFFIGVGCAAGAAYFTFD